jgi:hypothetical protein
LDFIAATRVEQAHTLLRQTRRAVEHLESTGTHLPLKQPARDELRQEVTDFLASISEA